MTLWRLLGVLFAMTVGCSKAEPSAGPVVECPPAPATEALAAWLTNDCYRGWAANSAVSASSMGPGGVRIFLNPVLARSIASGDAPHPIGSAAVREMYDKDHVTRVGWSASVKTPEGWFWFERFDRLPHPSVASRAAPGCTGCHASGRDQVQTAGPLPD